MFRGLSAGQIDAKGRITIPANYRTQIAEESNGSLVVTIDTPVAGMRERDVRTLTQAIFRHMEQVIRRYPDQWYIFRHLWVADAGRRAPARTA